MAILFTLLTFISTLTGGIVGIKLKDKLHLILGFTAGVILSLVAFEIFPEIISLLEENKTDVVFPMIALVIGFLSFHIMEKVFLIHNNQEDHYEDHKHPTLGILSASALSIHSFLDGVGIGLSFQISTTAGILVAIAVIAHDFSDGLNTASIMLLHKNNLKKTIFFVLTDAIAPVLGVLSTLFFQLDSFWLIIYLGFFAGFLLYISTAEILPEAHSNHSSYKTILMTIIGIAFIFIITRFI